MLSKEDYLKEIERDFEYYTQEEREEIIQESFDTLKKIEKEKCNFNLPWPKNLYATILRVKDFTFKEDFLNDKFNGPESFLNDYLADYRDSEAIMVIILAFKYGKSFEEIADYLSVHYNPIMRGVYKAIRFYCRPNFTKKMDPIIESLGEPLFKDDDEE